MTAVANRGLTEVLRLIDSPLRPERLVHSSRARRIVLRMRLSSQALDSRRRPAWELAARGSGGARVGPPAASVGDEVLERQPEAGDEIAQQLDGKTDHVRVRPLDPLDESPSPVLDPVGP